MRAILGEGARNRQRLPYAETEFSGGIASGLSEGTGAPGARIELAEAHRGWV